MAGAPSKHVQGGGALHAQVVGLEALCKQAEPLPCSSGKASAIRNGCQLKSLPVSFVEELIWAAQGHTFFGRSSQCSQKSYVMRNERFEYHAA